MRNIRTISECRKCASEDLSRAYKADLDVVQVECLECGYVENAECADAGELPPE